MLAPVLQYSKQGHIACAAVLSETERLQVNESPQRNSASAEQHSKQQSSQRCVLHLPRVSPLNLSPSTPYNVPGVSEGITITKLAS